MGAIKKHTRGGARVGAGRKRIAEKQRRRPALTVALNAAELAKVQAAALAVRRRPAVWARGVLLAACE